MALISCFAPTAEAALSIRVNTTNTADYPSWDPFRGEASKYSIPGILLMGDVQSDCTIHVDPAAGPAGQAILQAVDSQHVVEDSILVLRYNWLDYCATFDDIFDNLGSLNAQLKNLSLPELGAVVMDGDAKSNEDFGSPFTQLADARHWNQEVRLNISFIGSDTVLEIASLLAANNHALLATVDQNRGPWNRMWHSIGFTIVIRGLDVLAGLIFLYGLWVLAFIVRAKHDNQHNRRYLILIPGCIYLPLSIAFAPYKVTVPWRNAAYYVSLLFPFISLGLQMIMWGKLIYRIKRKKMNKFFGYFAYVTILVPTISSFLDGIGWLIPSVPIIRMIGEKGFMFATPAVILVQAVLIFYYATMFFKSLKGIAISQTTRTALIKITVLNLSMISFFILMLLSRIVSLMGLNMRSRSAYMTELVIFRFSFLFFYAACFRTLSIRQPTGSSMDSKGTSQHSSGHHKSASKNHVHYHGDDSNHGGSGSHGSSSGHRDIELQTKPSLHFNKHLSNHASKGFTISDPSSPSSYKSSSPGGPLQSPKLAHSYTSQQQLTHPESDYPDPYKFNDFGHSAQNDYGGMSPTSREGGSSSRDNHIDIDVDDEDRDSVYGSHRFSPTSSKNKHAHIGNGGRILGGKGRNSEGYARFDEDRVV
ncbi:hypothetical protein BGX34_009181 [Mortierella sp. NVP85]|nr:hypothetical protein BGX34_009181 [Mortierella sp. NVP85]